MYGLRPVPFNEPPGIVVGRGRSFFTVSTMWTCQNGEYDITLRAGKDALSQVSFARRGSEMKGQLWAAGLGRAGVWRL
jgi:hypothetical protein